MFVGENIVYLDLQKTGSTQIAKVLKSLPKEHGVKYRKHIIYSELPEEAKLHWDKKIKLGSIRNPLSWYVSFWAYGCDAKGAFFNNNTSFNWNYFKKNTKLNYLFIPRRFWKKVYSDVENKENFKAWLNAILFPKNKHSFITHPQNNASDIIGMYTHRYLRLYIMDFEKHQINIQSKENIQKLDKEYNVLDHIIKQENLQSDLYEFLFQNNLEIPDTFEMLFHKKTNTSKHLYYEDYYDKESISWIKEKDWFIIDKYNYHI